MVYSNRANCELSISYISTAKTILEISLSTRIRLIILTGGLSLAAFFGDGNQTLTQWRLSKDVAKLSLI